MGIVMWIAIVMVMRIALDLGIVSRLLGSRPLDLEACQMTMMIGIVIGVAIVLPADTVRRPEIARRPETVKRHEIAMWIGIAMRLGKLRGFGI